MKQQRHQTEKPKRRWVVIGPGIVLAMILAIQIIISNHKAASAPPIVEHQVIGAVSSQPLMPVQDISYIIARRAQLHLSASQTAMLNRLAGEWNARSQPVKADMDRDAAAFQKYMAKAGNKVSMRDLQSHAQAVSVLSGQYSGLRRIYWQKAYQVLDASQRKQIDAEVTKTPSIAKGDLQR